MVGDMPIIMSNTGGDNRVEFNAAMDHAIWYESPKFGGVSFDLFFSPGQNRTADCQSEPCGRILQLQRRQRARQRQPAARLR